MFMVFTNLDSFSNNAHPYMFQRFMKCTYSMQMPFEFS